MRLEPTQYDRPQSDLGKGIAPGKPWVIGVLGGASILFAVLLVVFVIRSRSRAKRGDLGPVSSRGGPRSVPPSSRRP
ncbi:MAG: hypothetical protein U0271_18655 [Polyangiaceae bacterium]